MPTGVNKNKNSKSKDKKSKSTSANTNVPKNSEKLSKKQTTVMDGKVKDGKETVDELNEHNTTHSSIKVDSIGPNRFQVLSFDQVKQLHRLINDQYFINPILGSQYFPIKVTLRTVVEEIRKRLKKLEIDVKDVRLSGAAAARILNSEKSSSLSSNSPGLPSSLCSTNIESQTNKQCIEIDIILTLDIPEKTVFHKIKTVLFQYFISLINNYHHNKDDAEVNDENVGNKSLSTQLLLTSKKSKQKNDNKIILHDHTVENMVDENKELSSKPIAHHINYDQFKVDYIQKMARFVRSNSPPSNPTSPSFSNSNPPSATGHQKFVLTHQDTTESVTTTTSNTSMKPLHNKDEDCWSEITVGYNGTSIFNHSNNKELKFDSLVLNFWFIDRRRRQYEFTIDSFQIVLDTIINFYNVTGRNQITSALFPTVVVESVSGSYQDALRHLRERVIFTKNPEEICGGGLLKYCQLLMLAYKHEVGLNIKLMEKYMCSRFFIDYPDIESQRNVIVTFIDRCEFDDETKTKYLAILFKIVSHSTVCLMSHERRQTFQLIQSLLNNILSEIEIQKSSVHLDEDVDGKQGWILDQVFFGTSYFPLQFYLTGPMMNEGLANELSFNENDGQIFICTGDNSSQFAAPSPITTVTTTTNSSRMFHQPPNLSAPSFKNIAAMNTAAATGI